MSRWQDRIARELGATTRTFRSPVAALLWWAEQRTRRSGRAVNLESVGSPASQERIDVTQATYARITRCLTPRHDADVGDETLAINAITLDLGEAAEREEAEQRVDLLVSYYALDTQRLMRRMLDAGFGGQRAAERYALYAERVLRRRFEAEGLLAHEEER